ncbi:hypothetical protein [uncultured Chryseobacterium sp.]|uniref:hypothetical protein n=1 Tax=uncultured Chryseobacterium sp. TaxID=259322 RepID=UPI0025EFEBA6|nr:hypothetical protein [uncultured Chryseobacterium sp.]
MTRKIISWLPLWAVFLFTFSSCVHDEVYSASDPESSEYTNKSLWKENEKYIKNVKQIFDEYADHQYFSSHFGTVYWDYATTMGTYDESLLEVPVIKNSEVSFILLVYREGDRVFFKRKDEENSKKFFHTLVFTDRKKHRVSGKIPAGNKTASKTVCYTMETTVTWTNDDGSEGPTFSFSETHCFPTGPSLPCQAVDVNQTCGGSGGGYGGGSSGGGGGNNGYPYPPAVQNPCEKLKAQNQNQVFKEKIAALDKPAILNLKKETGFSESKSGAFTPLPQAASTAGSDGMTVTVTPSLKGYIHTHLNDYLTGNVNENGEQEIKQPIRMFSPADVNTLMTMAGMATDGNYSELYGTMVSSYGNYTIMFTGTAADIKTGFDTPQWTNDYIAYRIRNPYWSFEKLFLNFLKERMNVQGIELYKIKDNGTVQKKTLNSNNNVQSSDCPQ